MATVASDERTGNFESPTTPVPRRSKWRLFKRVVVVLAALFALLLVVIAMQPSEFNVVRSTSMVAPPELVFEQVNDFRNWEAWSPWAKKDPNAKNMLEGPSTGTGSKFHWDGDSNVGAGSMTILDSKPNERVQIKLDFIRPFEGTNDVVFSLAPKGDQTELTWSMTGENNFIGRAISLVIDCEKMIGGDFDKGLANIKAIVEKPASN